MTDRPDPIPPVQSYSPGFPAPPIAYAVAELNGVIEGLKRELLEAQETIRHLTANVDVLRAKQALVYSTKENPLCRR